MAAWWQTRLVTELKMSESISVAVTPDELYGLVSDITRMGEWSPICRACWWDEGAGPQVGAWFTGRNETPERTWETRSQVVAADPGRKFAWQVNNGWVHWEYTFEPEDGGTRLTETWEFLPAGIAGFRERYGEEADAEIERRHDAAKSGIPATLAAIKAASRSHERTGASPGRPRLLGEPLELLTHRGCRSASLIPQTGRGRFG